VRLRSESVRGHWEWRGGAAESEEISHWSSCLASSVPSTRYSMEGDSSKCLPSEGWAGEMLVVLSEQDRSISSHAPVPAPYRGLFFRFQAAFAFP